MQITKSDILIIILCLFIFWPLSIATAREHSITGFYYPLKRDNFRSGTGFWLNPAKGFKRPGINGTYVLDDVYHAAIDIMANSSHDSVYAIADGEVMQPSTNGWGGGNVAVVIRHKLAKSAYGFNNTYFYALYGHISSASALPKGTNVRSGQKIGSLGDYSGGNHLHFAIRNDDSRFDKFGTVRMSDWPSDKAAWDLSKSNRHLLVDPIWFIDHNFPDNYLSRNNTSPGNLINIMNPWFSEKCIKGGYWTNPDERCDISQWNNATECYMEESDLCTNPDALPFWHPGSTNHIGVGGGGPINSPGPVPLPGPRSDTRPDFDIFNTSGAEISANSDNYTPKTVQVSQRIQTVLKTQVSNADVKNSLRDSDSNSIEGPVWWKIEDETGKEIIGWRLLVSEEFDVSDLDKNDEPDEKEWFTIPNYPGKTIVFAACTDGDDEVMEENESSTRRKATSPSTCGTNNRSRDEKLRIAWPKPWVSTWGASTVSQDSAILQGSIDPKGTPSYGYFDLGTSMSYGKTLPLGYVGAGNGPITKTYKIGTLTCGTTYYYRIRAVNTSGSTSGPAKSFRTVECPGTNVVVKPVYGFWSSSVKGHHMTISESGKNNLIDKYNNGEWDWQFEGTYFYALTKQIDGSIPVYQLWKSGYGHHYTSSLSERNNLLNSGTGWTEGYIAFYAYSYQRPGTVPIYRYYNQPITDHYFTQYAPAHYNSSCSQNSLNGKTALSSGNYNHCYEGVAWYAYPSLPSRPWVSTWGATNITQKSVTLQGRINPKGTYTTAYFDYGSNSSFGKTINLGNIGYSNEAILFTSSINELLCGKQYYYRIRANNDGGVSYGPTVTFSTSDCPPPPDQDNDGIPDDVDNCRSIFNHLQADNDHDGYGDLCDEDDDNDGIPDVWEIKYGLNPKDASDAQEDPDQDGFTNYQEYLNRTNPKDNPTDNIVTFPWPMFLPAINAGK